MAEWLIAVGIVGGVIVGPILLLLLMKFYVRCTIGRCRSQNRLDGKVVIVTGSNSGIGKKTAQVLAERGAKLIMACRNVEKAEKVAEDIRIESRGSNVVVKRLDLCELASVRSFAEEVLREEDKIDILVNNAGISGGDFKLTEDGFEEIYQANYLGPFYLTELLMPLLKKSPAARIISTGSSAYLFGNVSPRRFLNDLKTRGAISLFRYGDSKLAMLMWTKAMAEELKDTGIAVNYVHPGIVSTGIATHSSNISNLIFKTNIFIFGRTAEEGAQTILHLCLDPEGAKFSGRYWSECKPGWVIKANNKSKNQALVEATRKCLKLSA